MSSSQTLLTPPRELRILLVDGRMTKFRWIYSADCEYGCCQLMQRMRESNGLKGTGGYKYYAVNLDQNKLTKVMHCMNRDELDSFQHLIIMEVLRTMWSVRHLRYSDDDPIHADKLETIQTVVDKCVDAAYDIFNVHVASLSEDLSNIYTFSVDPAPLKLVFTPLGHLRYHRSPYRIVSDCLLDELNFEGDDISVGRYSAINNDTACNGAMRRRRIPFHDLPFGLEAVWQPQGNVPSSIRCTDNLYAVTDINGNIALLPAMSLLPSAGYWGLKTAPLPIAVDKVSPFCHDSRLALVSKCNSRGLQNQLGFFDTNMFAYPALHPAYPWIRQLGLIEAAQVIRNVHWKHMNFLSKDEIDSYFELKGHIEAKIRDMDAKHTKLSNLRASQYHSQETRDNVVAHHLRSLLLGQKLELGVCSQIMSACLSETDLIPKLSYLVSQPWQIHDELLSLHPVNRCLHGLNRDYHRMMKAYRPMSMYNRIAAASIQVVFELMKPPLFATPTSTMDLLCRRSQLKCQLAAMKAISDQKLDQRVSKPFLPPKKRLREYETAAAAVEGRNMLRSYKLPLNKRIKSRVIFEESRSTPYDRIADAADEPSFPDTDLLLYLKHLAEQKVTRREELKREPSALKGRFAPCALVAIGVVLEELVSEIMLSWTDRDHDESGSAPSEGPLRFSEHALDVEIDLQLDGCDVNFVTERQLQSRLEALFGRDLSEYSEKFHRCLEEYRRRHAKDVAYDTTPDLMDKLYPIGKRDEPVCGYDPRTCGAAVDGWYSSKVQSCRNMGLVAQAAARPGQVQAAAYNQRALPLHVQDAIIADRRRNSNARKDPVTLELLPRRRTAEDTKITVRKRKAITTVRGNKMSKSHASSSTSRGEVSGDEDYDAYFDDPDWP